jgi:hypothetical protein
VQCTLRLEHEGWDFLFHGVFCFLVFSNLTYTGYMHFYGERQATSNGSDCLCALARGEGRHASAFAQHSPLEDLRVEQLSVGAALLQ